MLIKENYSEASFEEKIRFKIKWIFRVLNCPFKKLESWM